MKFVRRRTQHHGRPDTTKDQRQKDPEPHVRFDATSHHSRSRLGLPPVPVPPAPGRRLALQPSCWGAFFAEPDPCRCAPLDRAREGYFHDNRNVIAPRLAQGAFFPQLVTQGTAPHGGGCQYLPIESTTGPTLPDGSPRNSTLLMALNLTHLPPLAPRFLPEGFFLCSIVMMARRLTPTQWSQAALT